MAGKVESCKIKTRYSGFLTIFISVFFLLIFLSGCQNQQRITFAENTTPEQKKVELKRWLNEKYHYDDSEAHFLLAQIYHSERNFDDAEFEYNRALQFDPVYRPAQAGLVKLYIDRGDTVKAQHYFENSLNQIGDNPIKIVEFAREFQNQGLDSYALAAFNKALQIAPKSAEVNKYLGYFYLNQNNKDKAREYFENSFNIDSTQEDVARELGKLGVPIIYDAMPPITEEVK